MGKSESVLDFISAFLYGVLTPFRPGYDMDHPKEIIIDGQAYTLTPKLEEAPATDSGFTKPFNFCEPYLFQGRTFVVSWNSHPVPVQPALTKEDVIDLATLYDVPPSAVDAVLEVESRGSGFLLNEPMPARPKILFEAHWFYRLTPLPVSKTRPDLSSPTWNQGLYKGGSAEWDRLADAMKFDFRQALKSCSYGLGQVMGFNHKIAGCDTIEQFIEENFPSEYFQALHMFNFCDSEGLIPAMRDSDWTTFARVYNGPEYAKNRYHIKLAEAERAARSKY